MPSMPRRDDAMLGGATRLAPPAPGALWTAALRFATRWRDVHGVEHVALVAVGPPADGPAAARTGAPAPWVGWYQGDGLGRDGALHGVYTPGDRSFEGVWRRGCARAGGPSGDVWFFLTPELRRFTGWWTLESAGLGRWDPSCGAGAEWRWSGRALDSLDAAPIRRRLAL